MGLLGGVTVLKKFFEREIGKITSKQMSFAKQGMKDENSMKGKPSYAKGERADKLATYIEFGRRHGI